MDPGHQDTQREVTPYSVSKDVIPIGLRASVRSRRNTIEKVLGKVISGQVGGRMMLARCTGRAPGRAAPWGSDGAPAPLATGQFSLQGKSVGFSTLKELQSTRSASSHPSFTSRVSALQQGRLRRAERESAGPAVISKNYLVLYL